MPPPICAFNSFILSFLHSNADQCNQEKIKIIYEQVLHPSLCHSFESVIIFIVNKYIYLKYLMKLAKECKSNDGKIASTFKVAIFPIYIPVKVKKSKY